MPDPAPLMSSDAPFYGRLWKSFEHAIKGQAGNVTERVSIAAHEHMGVRKADAAKWIPWIGGAAAGTVGLLLIEPLTKLGQAATNAAKQVVTGFGFLPKIPVIGSVFSLAGDAIDMVGNVSGAIFGGLASLVTFKALQVDATPPSYSHGDVTGAVMPASAVDALAQYTRGSPAAGQRLSPEAELRNRLRGPVSDATVAPATRAQVNALKDLLGGGTLGQDRIARITETQPLTAGSAEAVLKYLRNDRAGIRDGVAEELLGGGARRWLRINPFAQLRNIREATGIGTSFGRVARVTRQRMNARLDGVVNTIKENIVAASAESSPSATVSEPVTTGRVAGLAKGTINFGGNLAGAALFGYGAYHGAEKTAESFQNGEVAGTIVGGVEATAATSGAAIATGKAFGRMNAAGKRLGPLAAVVTAADGIHRTLHEDTDWHKAQRAAQTAVETTAVVGSDLAIKSALASGTGIAAKSGLAAAGAAALPLAVVAGAAFDLWGIHQCIETGIDTSRIYEAIDSSVKANTERLTNLKPMASRSYYLTAGSEHLGHAARNEQGNVDLTRLENIDKLRRAIMDAREAARRDVDDTSWFGTWRYLHFMEGQSQAHSRYEERKLDVRTCDAALEELNALETHLQKAHEAKSYAAAEAQKLSARVAAVRPSAPDTPSTSLTDPHSRS